MSRFSLVLICSLLTLFTWSTEACYSVQIQANSGAPSYNLQSLNGCDQYLLTITGFQSVHFAEVTANLGTTWQFQMTNGDSAGAATYQFKYEGGPTLALTLTANTLIVPSWWGANSYTVNLLAQSGFLYAAAFSTTQYLTGSAGSAAVMSSSAVSWNFVPYNHQFYQIVSSTGSLSVCLINTSGYRVSIVSGTSTADSCLWTVTFLGNNQYKFSNKDGDNQAYAYIYVSDAYDVYPGLYTDGSNASPKNIWSFTGAVPCLPGWSSQNGVCVNTYCPNGLCPDGSGQLLNANFGGTNTGIGSGPYMTVPEACVYWVVSPTTFANGYQYYKFISSDGSIALCMVNKSGFRLTPGGYNSNGYCDWRINAVSATQIQLGNKITDANGYTYLYAPAISMIAFASGPVIPATSVWNFAGNFPYCPSGCQNGGSCSGKNTCSCPAAWTGATCSVSACPSGCKNGGTCTGVNTCSCPAAWTGSDCSVSACSTTCNNGGTCTGVNTCACASGWTGSDCSVSIYVGKWYAPNYSTGSYISGCSNCDATMSSGINWMITPFNHQFYSIIAADNSVTMCVRDSSGYRVQNIAGVQTDDSCLWTITFLGNNQYKLSSKAVDQQAYAYIYVYDSGDVFPGLYVDGSNSNPNDIWSYTGAVPCLTGWTFQNGVCVNTYCPNGLCPDGSAQLLNANFGGTNTGIGSGQSMVVPEAAVYWIVTPTSVANGYQYYKFIASDGSVALCMIEYSGFRLSPGGYNSNGYCEWSINVVSAGQIQLGNKVTDSYGYNYLYPYDNIDIVFAYGSVPATSIWNFAGTFATCPQGCQNGGSCSTGNVCLCAAGWSGNDCSVNSSG